MQELELYNIKFIMLFLNKKLLLISEAGCLNKESLRYYALVATIESSQKDLKMEFINQVINGYIMSDGYVSMLGSLQIYHSSKQEKLVE